MRQHGVCPAHRRRNKRFGLPAYLREAPDRGAPSHLLPKCGGRSFHFSYSSSLDARSQNLKESLNIASAVVEMRTNTYAVPSNAHVDARSSKGRRQHCWNTSRQANPNHVPASLFIGKNRIRRV